MKFIELSVELEEEFFSIEDDFLWELLNDENHPLPVPVPIPIVEREGRHEHEEQKKCIIDLPPMSKDSFTDLLTDTNTYRQEAIKRWREKRDRRSFKKKIVSKARKDYADTRERKGGRFVKSKSLGWVAITEIKHGL